MRLDKDNGFQPQCLYEVIESKKPNAQTHLPPKAGAKRRLEAVRCSAVFGAVAWPCELLSPACPDQHFDVHHQTPVGLESR